MFVEQGECSQNMLSEAFWTPNTASSQFDEYSQLGSRSKSSPNRRSSEIQGTALGKCLQAWPVYTHTHTHMQGVRGGAARVNTISNLSANHTCYLPNPVGGSMKKKSHKTHTHARTHSRTHARTHTHTHTHTHQTKETPIHFTTSLPGLQTIL